jgi:hypothetical protein
LRKLKSQDGIQEAYSDYQQVGSMA